MESRKDRKLREREHEQPSIALNQPSDVQVEDASRAPEPVQLGLFDDVSPDGYWLSWERRRKGYAGIIASLVTHKRLTDEELKNDNGVFTCAVVPRVEKRIEDEGLKFDYESAMLVALEELPE